MDLSFPDCKPDGYYAAKQCHWAACYCVNPNGDAVEGEKMQGDDFGNRNIKCPGDNNNNNNVGRVSECKDGETKKMDCNTCKCSMGRWACTQMFCFNAGSNTNTMNTMNTMNNNDGASASAAASGEACLSACTGAHEPWKVIAVDLTDARKQPAWTCVDKCVKVTCERKCEIVFPNRGEEMTVMKCKMDRCKKEKRTTVNPKNNNYGVKGGARRFVTKRPGVKS